MSDQPALPYPEPGGQEHTGGWSGSDTSHERALDMARSGSAARLQHLILGLAARAGHRGVTVREVRAALPYHHGSCSGTLTNLHEAGRLARLTLRRGSGKGAKVYVLPEYVDGRPTEEKGRTKAGAAAYDEGHRDGSKAAADAYAEGYADGRTQGRVDAAGHVRAVVLAMRNRTPRPLVRHHSECWREHPGCALDAALAAANVAMRTDDP